LVAEAALPEATPAFAMTVHKSQGSEYDRVLIALPADADHRMLRRELLYTALTRAREAAWIYGPESAIQAAVSQSQPRDSGLRWW
jgi:exodeoxyribonuclease V alpha subunit